MNDATMRILLLNLALILPSTLLASPEDDFWNRLQALCGQAFSGELQQAPVGENAMRDKPLIMHLRDCGSERIRIPFMVGADRSRTWVLTRRGERIELKHDHRHQDGSLDEITMYGGTTANTGVAGQQFFPADQATREMIEAAHANVWTIAIEPGERFTYGLWRLGTDRVYRIDFDLNEPVEPPPAPWGWEEGS